MMKKDTMGQSGYTRRDFLRMAGATGLAMGLGGTWSASAASAAEGEPWSYIPKGPKPKKLVFTSWEWSNRYKKFLPRWEEDWGIPLVKELTPPGPTQFDRAYTLFAAGDQLDVMTSLITDRAGFLGADMIRPIDDMPGVEEYVKDFHRFTKECLVVDGKVWGLPYFVETWVPLYYEDLLHKAGFDKPFEHWDELIEQGLKAKKDKVSEYPLLWCAGVGTEQLPGCWFGLTWSMGGVFFDKKGNHALGAGSVARKALKWWQDTFLKTQISDPRSLELRFIPAVKAYMQGKFIYLLIQREYYLSFANDKAQSPIAGHVRAMGLPNNRIIGAGHGFVMCTATANPEWAWKLLQLVGGKTKDGEYSFHNLDLELTMAGSGYKSVMTPENYLKRVGKWVPEGNEKEILAGYENATGVLEILPVMLEPWYRSWVDALNVQVQKCLRGEISPDVACDNLIEEIDKAKRKAKV